jgi:3-oxoacyl-[acyl-carrier-protein] synthase-3
VDDATIGMLSAAYYLPPLTKRITDVFRDERIPTTPFAAGIDFQRDIGIESVHLGGAEPPSDIGLEASRRALTEAGVDGAELDLIIDFTSIPEDYVAPTWAAAGRVQEQLGAKSAFATAVNTGGCTSYHVALRAARAWMLGDDRFRTALLFAGDKTPALNKTYYPITVTCDGGSAVVLRRGHLRRTLLAVEVITVGELHDVWYVPGPSTVPPGAPFGEEMLYMRSDMKRFNESVITINLFMFRKVMKAAMKSAGVKAEDIACYVYPTFSTWDQRSFSRGLGIPPEKLYTDGLARHGHLQENDMVMNYVDAARQERFKEGDLVMVTTNGAGFAWGAAVIRH